MVPWIYRREANHICILPLIVLYDPLSYTLYYKAVPLDIVDPVFEKKRKTANMGSQSWGSVSRPRCFAAYKYYHFCSCQPVRGQTAVLPPQPTCAALTHLRGEAASRGRRSNVMLKSCWAPVVGGRDRYDRNY